MTGGPLIEALEGEDAHPQELRLEDGTERTSRFRILTVNGRRRAFSLEPIFWSILEEAAHAESMRLGEYVTKLLAGASRSNHSALLRVKAAEWVAKQRERFQERGYLAIGRRLAASHEAPCFLIDQRGAIVAHNKSFNDLLRSAADQIRDPEKLSVQLRLGVTVVEMMRLLRANPEKFLRVRFSLLYDGCERPGVLNAMFVGEEKENCYALGFVQSAGEVIPRR
jgi:predicted DNA-binding ribbon-helix-helix protein